MPKIDNVAIVHMVTAKKLRIMRLAMNWTIMRMAIHAMMTFETAFARPVSKAKGCAPAIWMLIKSVMSAMIGIVSFAMFSRNGRVAAGMVALERAALVFGLMMRAMSAPTVRAPIIRTPWMSVSVVRRWVSSHPMMDGQIF